MAGVERLRTASALLAVLVLAGCTMAAVEGSDPAEVPTSGLTPGDRVGIDIAGEPDLSGAFELDLDGVLELPLIGAVDAYGLTAEELQGVVVARYADGYLRRPVAQVTLLTPRPFFISGAVPRPGSYTAGPGMTVAEAVVLAGGSVDAASPPSVRLIRDGRGEAVDLQHPVAPGDILELGDAAG